MMQIWLGCWETDMCKALPCNSQVEIGAALFKQIFLADLALIRTSLTISDLY
jgi:hypothetical protein